MSKDYYSQEIIYEPLKEYDRVLREMHERNVNKFFEKLLEKSKVNVEENEITVKEIYKLEADSKKTASQQKKMSLWKLFLIILFVVFIAAAGILFYQGGTAKILIAAALLVADIGWILIIVKIINPTLKNLSATQEELQKQLAIKYKEAWAQMEPLNKLFKIEMAAELFQKTLPMIKLEPQFDSKQLEYLVKKFGYRTQKNADVSTLYIQSGHINGNPFFITDTLNHKLGVKTYTGSIVIHWTTTTTDSKGNRITVHHTQTLTASVNKPCPYYKTVPYLVYGNEAAPDLRFTRTDSDAEIMSEKQIERHIKKEVRKLKKATKKDPSAITLLGNEEFEVLWKAQNRNNEVQFRLLFTVLAQKELLALMKDKTIGYGDDFNFVKDKMINYVYPEHLSKFNLAIRPSVFHSFDLKEAKRKFITYQNHYFKHLYFTFAPILAIPLYQQHKPREYIYGDVYDSYVSFYEHEKAVNYIGENHFKHPLSGTRNILKTSTVKSNDYCDYVTVTAYGYETKERVDYITKRGGDGKMHTIPVPWIEYIPVQQSTDVEIHVPKEEQELTYEQRIRKMFEDLQERRTIDEKSMFRLSTFLVLLNQKNKEEK